MPRLSRKSLAVALVAGLLSTGATLAHAQSVPDQGYDGRYQGDGSSEQDGNASQGQRGYDDQGDEDDRYGQPGYDDGGQGQDGPGYPGANGYDQGGAPEQGYPSPQDRSYPETTRRDDYGAPPYEDRTPDVSVGGYGQGQGPDSYRPGYDGGYYQPPRAFVGGNGAGRVVVSEGCTAFYDRYGQRETATNGCTRRDLWSADDTMARYRRERGL